MTKINFENTLSPEERSEWIQILFIFIILPIWIIIFYIVSRNFLSDKETINAIGFSIFIILELYVSFYIVRKRYINQKRTKSKYLGEVYAFILFFNFFLAGVYLVLIALIINASIIADYNFRLSLVLVFGIYAIVEIIFWLLNRGHIPNDEKH